MPPTGWTWQLSGWSAIACEPFTIPSSTVLLWYIHKPVKISIKERWV